MMFPPAAVKALILKYELPGSPDQLVDLLCDDDVTNMWEALDEHCRTDQKPTFKLKVVAQQASCEVTGRVCYLINVGFGHAQDGMTLRHATCLLINYKNG